MKEFTIGLLCGVPLGFLGSLLAFTVAMLTGVLR